MAPHSSTLAWRIPGTGSLVGCHLWDRTELDMTERLHFHFHAFEKEMATHSSVLAWRIPGTGSLVGCRLLGCTESDTTEATQQQQQTSSGALWRETAQRCGCQEVLGALLKAGHYTHR